MLVPKETYRDRDCLLHAIFGDLTDQGYYCVSALEKRQFFAAAIRTAKPGTALSRKIPSAIQAWIMDLELKRGTRSNNEYLEWIGRNCGRATADLYATSMQTASFSWEHWNPDPKILDDYANFVRDQSLFLLEADIELITEVFGIQVNYYTREQTTGVVSHRSYAAEGINNNTPGVHICFDGINHIERIPAPEPNLSSPVISVNSIREETEKENKDKALESRQKDILKLFDLVKYTSDLIHQDLPSQDVLKNYLLTLGDSCKKISRNKDDGSYIRNMYGKFNYKKNSINLNYIPFDLFSKFAILPEDDQQEILNIILHHWLTFKAEFIQLIDNFLQIIHNELQRNELKGLLLDIRESDFIRLFPGTSWNNATNIQNLIEIYNDLFCLQKLCAPEWLNLLQQLDNEQDSVKVVYTFARVLTVLGETARNLSDFTREIFSDLSLKLLNKIRDQLGHTHYKTVKKITAELVDFRKSFVAFFPAWQEEIRKRLQFQRDIVQDQFSVAKSIDLISQRNNQLFDLLSGRLRPLTDAPLSLGMKIPETINIFDASLLSTLRIRRLKNIRKDLLVELSKSEDEERRGNDENTQGVINPFAEDIARVTKTITTLEEKTELIEKEKKILASAILNLAKLNRKAKQAPAIKKQTMRPPEQIKEDLQLAEKELDSMERFPGITKLLEYLTPKKGNKGNFTPEEKLHRLVKGLVSELKVLDKLFKLPDIGRRFALEHCLSAIGQYLRDIREANNSLVQYLLLHNKVVSTALKETVAVRSEKIMHDDQDHTPDLLDLVLMETLPLGPDIDAIKRISESKIAEIREYAIHQLVQHYYEIGIAYTRLNMHKDSVEAYKKGIQVLSPEFMVESMGVKLSPDSLIKELVNNNDAEEIAKVATSQPGKIVVLEFHMAKIVKRIILNVELGTALTDLKDFNSAYTAYMEAAKWCNRYKLWGHPDINKDVFLGNFASILILNNDDPDIILKRMECLLSPGTKEHTLVILNSIAKLLTHKKLDVAKKLIKKINPEMITDKFILVTYYQRNAEVNFVCLTQTYAPNVTQMAVGENILKDIDQAKDILNKNFHQLKAEQGDKVTRLVESLATTLKSISQDLAIYIANQGVVLSATDPRTGREFLNYALILQKKYNYDPGKTIQALADTYFTSARSASNNTQIDILFKKVEDYSDQILNHQDPSLRLSAFMNKAEVCYLQKKLRASIPYYIKALVILTFMKDKDHDALEDEQIANQRLNEAFKLDRNYFVKLSTMLQQQIKEPANVGDDKKNLQESLNILKKFLEGHQPKQSSQPMLHSSSPLNTKSYILEILQNITPGKVWDTNFKSHKLWLKFSSTDDAEALNRHFLKNGFPEKFISVQQINIAKQASQHVLLITTIDFQILLRIPPFETEGQALTMNPGRIA